MQACKVTIITTEKERETKIVRTGKIDIGEDFISLFYQEENANVTLYFQGDKGKIIRNGDYTLRIFLQKHSSDKGWIGIAGGEGEIQTYTHKFIYSLNKNVFMALLHYNLIISGERQEMRLRISAQIG